ncbi:hypothetical protein LINGRAHAP2_LOCUS12874, partial [Linum grandiflorum]
HLTLSNATRQSIFEPIVAEAIGLLNAIRWVIDLQFPQVLFEGDVLTLHNTLTESESDSTELGDIVRMIAGLQRCWDSYSYVAVRRERNQVAYTLVRKFVFHTFPFEGHVPPQDLVEGSTVMCSENHH